MFTHGERCLIKSCTIINPLIAVRPTAKCRFHMVAIFLFMVCIFFKDLATQDSFISLWTCHIDTIADRELKDKRWNELQLTLHIFPKMCKLIVQGLKKL